MEGAEFLVFVLTGVSALYVCVQESPIPSRLRVSNGVCFGPICDMPNMLVTGFIVIFRLFCDREKRWMPLEIHHAIIHKLNKTEGNLSTIGQAPSVLPTDDVPLLQLINDVHLVYSNRQNKSYGVFDPELTTTSAEPHLKRLRDEKDADFYQISVVLMQTLKSRSDERNFATGGHVLIFDYTINSSRWFVVALVSSAPGAMVDDNYKVVTAPHLDVAGIRFAGRVNIGQWKENEQRYISFLSGKGAEVSQYFQKFLGCSTSQKEMEDTRNLVKVIKQFATDQNLDDVSRERLLTEVNRFAMDKADSKEPLILGELANRVWPTAPESLNTAFAEADPPISDGFIPRKRGLDALVRFKAKTSKWALEFEREVIQNHTITVDPDAKTLIIKDLPDDFLARYKYEFLTDVSPDDPAH